MQEVVGRGGLVHLRLAAQTCRHGPANRQRQQNEVNAASDESFETAHVEDLLPTWLSR